MERLRSNDKYLNYYILLTTDIMHLQYTVQI